MKTYVHLWYLAEFLLHWEMFQTESLEKIKKTQFCSVAFSRKSCHSWDNVEKYCRRRHATDGNTIIALECTCWISKATDTHSEYVILIAFPRHQWLYNGTSMLYSYIHCLPSFYLRWLLFLFSWEKIRGRITWTFSTDMWTQTVRLIMSFWATLPLCWILGNV
jgi:hypothetical protein